MTFSGPAHRLIGPVEQLIDAWHNLKGNGRATWILLALFVLAWTAFHTLVFASIDLHPDLTEIYAWSRHPSAGYYKHPPLPALVAGVWFAIFPVAEWSMNLPANATSALGLFAVDLIVRRYLSGDKRLLALLGCVAEAVRRSLAEPQVRRSDIEVARRYLGGWKKTERFMLIFVSPKLSPSSTQEKPT